MLYFNGKKYFVPLFNMGGSADNSIVGTWVFKGDYISLPYDMYGKTYYFSYYFNDTNGKVELNEFQFSDDYGATHYIAYANNETGYYAEVYDDNRQWGSNYEKYKTITITKAPTDTTFIDWLKANATKQESVVGTWKFKDELDMSEAMRNKIYYFDYSVETEDSGVQTMKAMRFMFYGNVKQLTYIIDEDNPYIVYNESEGLLQGWSDERYKTITIDEDPTDDTFIAWLKENATRESESEYPKYDGKALLAEVNADDESNVYFIARFDTPTVVDHHIISEVPLSTFGDAEPSDVRKGVWFTSSAGLEIQGTNEGDGGIIEVDEDPRKKPTHVIRDKVYRYEDKYYKFNETNVWVFDDEIGANGAEALMGKTYKFEYSVNIPNVGKVTMNEMAFVFDGSYLTISYSNDEYTFDEAYNERYGWANEMLKTIEFNEMPEDEALADWLFEEAMVVGSWEEYVPTTDTIVTGKTWVFNEELTNIDKPFENGFEDVACSGYMLYDNVDEPFNFHFTTIRFYNENSSLERVSLINSDESEIGIYYIDNFVYHFRHGTITFTELPDDETFIEWLKENATKEESIVGTWVFNDELTMPDEMSSHFNCDFYVETEMDGTQRLSEVYIFNIDEQIGYWGISYYGSEYNIEDVYESEYGWATQSYKTIKIAKEPTDQAFIAWLKANATKQTTAIAYTAKSVDELPSDAPDGSMALVESDSLVGEWEWKDNESPLDFSMLNIDSEHGANIGIRMAGYDYFQEHTFSDVIFSKNDDDDITVSFSEMDIYVDGEWDDTYKTFAVFIDPSEYELNNNQEIDEFKTFIKTNCNRLSGGYSLYIRQNGEWVYEREAEMSGGADDNAPRFYELSSGDELPEDAPDGSVARFPNTSSLYGYWYGENNQEIDWGMFHNNFEYLDVYMAFSVSWIYDQPDYFCTRLRLDKDNDNNFRITIFYGEQYIEIYSSRNGWSIPFNYINIYNTTINYEYDNSVTDADSLFREFLMRNFVQETKHYEYATRVDGSWEI